MPLESESATGSGEDVPVSDAVLAEEPWQQDLGVHRLRRACAWVIRIETSPREPGRGWGNDGMNE
jgi:hypothetical protein